MKETKLSHGGWLCALGGTSAAAGAALFVLGAVAPIADAVPASAGRVAPLGRNWLAVLFELNAGLGDLHFDSLRGRNPLDIVIMALVGAALLGLARILSRGARGWSLAGVVLVGAGIALFIVTGLTGRSSVMAALLVASVAMLWDGTFRRTLAPIGMTAGALLLAGDIATGPQAPSITSAAALGVGYLLLTAWLALVATRLLRAGRGAGFLRR